MLHCVLQGCVTWVLSSAIEWEGFMTHVLWKGFVVILGLGVRGCTGTPCVAHSRPRTTVYATAAALMTGGSQWS
jgi:hypothetical protein